jgi:beta-lactamase superfamily II metal-dependent hydrolase/transposase-like protein
MTRVKVLSALVILFSTACAISQVANGNLQIYHVDMGQGDAAILISPKGQVVLFDAGKDVANKKNCDVETDCLDQLDIQKIDYIFVSHYHTDHIGCIPAVLKQFPLTGNSYDRGGSYTTTYYTNYLNAVANHRKTVTLGQTITLDSDSIPVTLTVDSLNGTYPGGHVSATNENDLSVSVLVSFGAFREEIGGDLSGENTSDYEDIDTGEAPSIGPIDVYKVHHHCSAYSTNETWLKDTQPTVAIISTGDGNDYGHPSESCLERLHGADVQKVYWTEKGSGGTPQAGDVIAGDVAIEVTPNAMLPKTQKLSRSEVESLRSSWFSEEGEESLKMAKKGHSEEEILRVLREAESGETVVEVCRKHGISQQSFYLWKKKYAGLGLSELRELRQLREENNKLKRLVADLSLDRHILQEIVAKKL